VSSVLLYLRLAPDAASEVSGHGRAPAGVAQPVAAASGD